MSILDELAKVGSGTATVGNQQSGSTNANQGQQITVAPRRMSGEERAEQNAPAAPKVDVLSDTLKNLGLLNTDYAAKEAEYKAAQDAYTKAMQNAPADADFDTYLQPYRDRANAAEAALRSSRQNYENAGGEIKKTNWGNLLSNRNDAGWTSALLGTMKGADFLAGDFVDEGRVLADQTLRGISGGKWGLDLEKGSLLDRAIAEREAHLDALNRGNEQNVGENDKAAQAVSKYMPTVVQAIPQAVLALMTMGGSAGTQASTAALQQAAMLSNSSNAAQVLIPAAKAFASQLKDPQWGMSFISTVGNDYEEALADGASQTQAAIYALLTSGVNATIEVGGGDETLGGLQKLPESWRRAIQAGDNNALLQLVKSAKGEVLEEIEQGITSESMKSLYRDVSASEIFDPERMKEEAKGAAITSLFLGGGQMAATNAIESAAQRRSRGAQQVLDLVQPTQAAAGTAPVQNAAETPSEAPQPVAPESVPAEAPAAESAPAPALNNGETVARTIEERIAENQRRMDEINRQLDNLPEDITDEEVNALVNEGMRLDQESRALEFEATQQARIQGGEVSSEFGTPENHIDNRTNASVASQRVKAFQFDHPELHDYFVEAAKVLADQVMSAETNTLVRAGQKGSAVKRGPVRMLMDLGMTKPRIMQCLNDIIQNNGAENYADAKRVEIVLNDMMTNGWIGLNRQTHDGNPDYIAAKEKITGAVKSDSWEKYLADREWMISTGDATEAELRAEWEAQHPELREETKPNMMPDGETVYVSDRLTNSIPSIEGMEPVANLSTGDLPSISTDSLLDRARAMFEKIFGIVNRKGFGDVEINKRGAKNDLSHGNGAAKTAVIPAIPAIIESGEQIDFQKNWKGRPYDGYTFAAPIILDGKTVYVAAVVLQTSKNKFYLHEVVDSDGNYIKFGDTSEANRTSLVVNDDAGTSDVSPNMGDASPISNIPQSAPVVNGESGPGLPPTDTTTAESTNGRGRERERGVSKDVRTNPNTDEPLRDSFEQNREMYHQLTNAEVTERANAIIDKGFDAARSEVEQAIGRAKAGMKLPPEIAVAGYQIANEMSRRGDLESARNLCADIAAELTAGGQLGQIGRLILNSDPAVRGMTVQKIVDKLNDGLSERQKAKNRNRGVGDESGQISVDDALVDSYVNAEDDAAASAALEQIEQNIADQIPATFRDKFTALRYLNMLGNLKTQGRNIIGNTLMLVATNAKYTTQSVAELAAAVASGGKYQRNTSLFANADLRRQAAADFDANIDEIKGESRYADVAKQSIRSIADKQRVFDSKILEGARKATNWAMDQGDVIFMRAVYTRAFAGWMQAHGVTDVANATADQLSSARAFAAKEAQEATFHDNNAVSDWVSRIGRGQNTPAAVRAVSEGIMPFRKTPANVAVRAVEYSPVGIAETVYKGVQAAKGNATAADVINSAAKNATGTALAIAGFFLAAAGKARGSGNDEDKELNDFQKMQGAMDYSVKIGDTHISLSQFAPSAIPFFMGVKLQELLANNEDLSLDNIGDMLGVISDPMLEMSMLQGVNDLIGDIASLNGNTDAIPSLVANAALSYLSQGLTNTLLGQAEQASEANRQTTYSDTKSKDANAIDQLLGSKGQYQIGKMSAKMPGWDYNQQDYVDAWGRTQSNGESGKRIINAFINPTYLSGDRSTKVDTELERLHNENADVEGFPNVFPQKRSRSATIGDGIVMTPDEYLEYSKAAGQKKLELVSDFMDSAEYKTLSDTQRAEVIQNLYSFADDLALQGIKRDNGITKQSDYQKLLSGKDAPGTGYDVPALKEKNAGEYIAFNSAYSSAQKDADYNVIDDLLKQYSKLDSNTRDVLTAKNPKDLKNLLAFGNAGSGSESYYKIKAAIGDAQWDLDANSAQGSHVRMAGLADADVSTAEKDKLVDSGAFNLSGTAKSTYGILRDFGMQPKDISQWFENADWYASGTGKDPKADGLLNAYEVATAISKIPNLSDQQRNAMYQQFKQAIQRPNDAYDTWKEKSYTQALRQSTSYGRVTGKGAEMPSTAEATASAGQTQNVIDYLLNLGRN